MKAANGLEDSLFKTTTQLQTVVFRQPNMECFLHAQEGVCGSRTKRQHICPLFPNNGRFRQLAVATTLNAIGRLRFYYTGLGYKIFKRFNSLIIWLGRTHYLIISIPPYTKILLKKKRFYLVSADATELANFSSFLQNLKRIDVYKGKGLLRVKKYKGFIRMKTGKKKQY